MVEKRRHSSEQTNCIGSEFKFKLNLNEGRRRGNTVCHAPVTQSRPRAVDQGFIKNVPASRLYIPASGIPTALLPPSPCFTGHVRQHLAVSIASIFFTTVVLTNIQPYTSVRTSDGSTAAFGSFNGRRTKTAGCSHPPARPPAQSPRPHLMSSSRTPCVYILLGHHALST